MNDRVYRILEFDKIRDMLGEQCRSAMGRELAAQLEPESEWDAVNVLLSQTKEADDALVFLGRSPVEGFSDMRPELKKSRATLALAQKELLDISKCMRVSRLCRESLSNENITGHLNRLANQLHTCRAVEEEIQRCILSEDEIADSASQKLSDIRRQMRSCADRMREKLNQYINSKTYRQYLQDPIITMRNGRYVLPVKQENRAMIQGLLHDQSASGATLFIEPISVVQIGNELKQFQIDEQEEISRILAALTAMCADNAEPLIYSLETLAELDVIFAKAKLAQAMRAVKPELNKTGYIRIIAGRHPLIPREQVVPIDIWLGRDFQTLIITGPNTGGKTVTLKTVGLFSLMTQSGLFLPAQDGVEMPVFSKVFADIGDEQSIEQSLSTFSSHMRNIVKILDDADDSSLVLLDELGSGTDPVEGAALAMSILDELRLRGSTTLSTTHYSELKAFALTREGMENACMEFDVNTLRPTFRLFIGIPGKSNAFEISRKLGLSDIVIKNAQEYLDGNDIRFEDVISNAESQRRIAEEEMRNAQSAREELYKLREAAENERKKQEAQRDKIIKRANEESKAIIRKAKDEAEGIIKKLKALSQNDAGRDRVIQEARDTFREKESAFKEEQITEQYGGTPPKTVKPGDTVFVVTLDTKASVLTAPDAKGDVSVQAGILKANVKLENLRLLSSQTGTSQKPGGRTGLVAKSRPLELDVRGQNAEEALMEVDKYIDDAAVAHMSEVSIIHGKGTGVLRAAIHGFLRSDGRVKAFRLGKYGEGESGVTVVTIK